MFRRGRFRDVIARQLDVFVEDYADLIREVAEAEQAQRRASRDEAEELYGDYVDLVETGTEALADLRDNFARTLDEEAAEAYEAEFNRAVVKKLPTFGLEIENR